MQAEISKLVNTYFYWSSLALTASFLADEEAELARIQKAPLALREIIIGRHSQACENARIKVSTAMKEWRPHDKGAYDRLKSVLFDLAHCSGAEIKNSCETEGWDEFTQWDVLVRDIATYFHRIGYPTSVSKDRTSPFVSFISELQKFFPETLPRLGTHSLDALTMAITRFRKASRDRQIEAALAQRSSGTLDATA
jgi:hypothetical protein